MVNIRVGNVILIRNVSYKLRSVVKLPKSHLFVNYIFLQSTLVHLHASYNPPLCIVHCWIQDNRNVSKQTLWAPQCSPNEADDMMKFLNTSLLTVVGCLCLSPPSNQCSWLSADVIIINLFRRASDDWWEAHPNQWRMHDKCLLWRLWQQHLRWSGCSPHYTTNTALANNSLTLRPDL